DRGDETVFVVGLISDSVELPSWFCNAQTIPVTGLTFNPSTSPAMENVSCTAPLKPYRTIVLSPEPPVEEAVLPYSIQTDPSPMVTESGFVPPTGPPVAKTETFVTVWAVPADTLAAMSRAVIDRPLMLNIVNISP